MGDAAAKPDSAHEAKPWRTYAWSIVGALLPIFGAPVAYDNATALISASQAQPPVFNIANVWWLLVGVITTLAGLLITAWDQRRSHATARRLERTRAHSVTRFTDELGSTLDVLVDFARSDGGRAESDKLIKSVLREGRRLYAHPGVRLCLYMLEETEAEEQQERRHHLQLRAYDGRRDSPRSEFVTGPHAESLIRIALSNHSVAVPDPDHPPEGVVVNHTEHSGWKSYLAVPVISHRESIGVLLIDTRETTEWNDEDKSIGWTISRLLVHGLQESERKAANVVPPAVAWRDLLDLQSEWGAASVGYDTMTEDPPDPDYGGDEDEQR